MKHYLAVMGLATALPLAGQTARPAEKQAQETIAALRVQGRVGGSLDTRVRRTERSYNYKLRATWVTPAVFEAAGRILEIAKGLPESEVARVLSEARTLLGAFPRDYAYDLFVVRFPLETGGGTKLLERPDDARTGCACLRESRTGSLESARRARTLI